MVVRIDSLEYFWGLFDTPEEAAASGAMKRLCLGEGDIPARVQQSFRRERIEELRGEFGEVGLGQPEEVSPLKVSAQGEIWETRVFNHAILLAAAAGWAATTGPCTGRMSLLRGVRTRSCDQERQHA
jgi:hypothetical protein